MIAAKINLKLDQGADTTEEFIWGIGTKESNTPVDLTGCQAVSQVRPSVTSETVLVELTTANGGITFDPLVGKVFLHFKRSHTLSTNWTTGVYDVFIIHPDSTRTRLVHGTITTDPDITRGL